MGKHLMFAAAAVATLCARVSAAGAGQTLTITSRPRVQSGAGEAMYEPTPSRAEREGSQVTNVGRGGSLR
jgi:hypothetical protein